MESEKGKQHDKIACIVCKKELDNLVYSGRDGRMIEVHPMGGLHFRTHGHYGSTIFDPIFEALELDVAICDLCIMANLDSVRGTGKQSLLDEVDILVDAVERHG